MQQALEQPERVTIVYSGRFFGSARFVCHGGFIRGANVVILHHRPDFQSLHTGKKSHE